jgi:hypothetical protein
VLLVSYSAFMPEKQYMHRREFFELLGMSYATGFKYIKIGVLIPDALAGKNGKFPLFDHNKVRQHMESIERYRDTIKAAKMNEIKA